MDDISRRAVLAAGAAGAAAVGLEPLQAAPPPPAPPVEPVHVTLTINGQRRSLELDPRTSLLDMAREHLKLTGSKKGCDHGQCGACTMIVEGRRILSCLSLAVMHDGERVTTIE